MDKQILTMESNMPFGKYKGYKIKDLIETWHFLNSPQNYLVWAIRTWKNVEFSEEIIKLINENQRNLSNLQDEYKRIESIRDKSEDVVDTKHKCKGKLEHYNDLGAMTDISFQDVYGDFGY